MYMSSKHSTDEAKENITFKILKKIFKVIFDRDHACATKPKTFIIWLFTLKICRPVI